MSKIDYNEMTKMLRNTLVDKEIGKKTKWVRFVDEVNEKISFIQENCLAIYDGFYCLNQIINCILYCCENINEHLVRKNDSMKILYKKLERQVSIESQKTTDTKSNDTVSQSELLKTNYQQNVISNLDKIKKILSELSPLNFRLEILENIYGLIFLTSNDLKQNNDDESEDSADDYPDNPIIIVDNEKRNSYDDFEIVESLNSNRKSKEIDGSIYETTNNSLYLNDSSKSALDRSLTSSKLKRFKSNTIYDEDSSYNPNQPKTKLNLYTRNPGGGDIFLMNDFLCRDILLLLKDSLQIFNTLDAKSQNCENIKNTLLNCSISNLQEVTSRSKKLYQLINETLWRFQLIKIDSITMDYGLINIIDCNNNNYAQSDHEQNLIYQLMKKRKRRDSNVSNISTYESLSKNEQFMSLSLNNKSVNKNTFLDSKNSYQSIKDKRKSIESHRSLSLIYPHTKNKNTNATIMKLLCDFETLSVLCLKNNKISEANQLVKMYSTKQSAATTFEFSQIIFNNVYKKTLDELNRLNNNNQDHLMQSLSLSKLIENLMDLEKENLLIQSIFLCDLIIISRIDLDLINQLIEYCTIKLNNLENENQIVQKLNMFINMLKTLSLNIKTKQINLKFDNLIDYTIKFNAINTYDLKNGVQTSIDKSNKFNNLLKEISLCLNQIEQNENFDNLYQNLLNSLKTIDNNEDILNAFVLTNKNATNQESLLNDSLNNYLLSFYEYVKTLHEYLREKSTDTFLAKSKCIFSILDFTPASLICKLLFEDMLKPESLEALTHNLNLNLTAIILHNSCPRLKLLITDNKQIIDKNIRINSDVSIYNTGYFYLVLNESDVFSCSRKKPHEFVKELLSDVLVYLRNFNNIDIKKAHDIYHSVDFKKLLNRSQELQHLNLDYLQSDCEKLSFFINLHNLLSIHSHFYMASIKYSKTSLNESSNNHDDGDDDLFLNKTDRILFEQKMAYKIGQMGCISLYDLKYHILFRRDSNELNIVNSSQYENTNFSSPSNDAKNLKLKSLFNKISPLKSINSSTKLSTNETHVQASINFENNDDLCKYSLYEIDTNAEPHWSKYLPSEHICDYKILFALINCTQCDPAICVFNSNDLLNDQLQMQMKLFLNDSVYADNEKEILYVPSILIENIYCFIEHISKKLTGFLPIKNENTPIIKNEMESLVKFLIDNVKPDLKENIKNLLNLDSIHGYGENIDLFGRKELPFPIVKLSSSNKFTLNIDNNSQWYKKQIDKNLQTETNDTKSPDFERKNLNQECLDYIRKQSPLVSTNLYFLFDLETRENFFRSLNDLKIKNLIDYDLDNESNNYLNRFVQLYVPLDYMNHLKMSHKLDMITQFLLNNRTEESKIELIIDLANYYALKQDWHTVLKLLNDCTQDNEEFNDLNSIVNSDLSMQFINDINSKTFRRNSKQKDLYNLYDHACICLANQESKLNDKSYLYLFKMRNLMRQLRAVFGLMDLWSIDGCLEIIYFCLNKCYDLQDEETNDKQILIDLLNSKKLEFIAYKDLTVCAQNALEKYYEHQQKKDECGFNDNSNEVDVNMSQMKRVCQRCLTWQYAKAQLETSSSQENDETKELIMDLYLLNDQFTSAKYLVRRLNLGERLQFKLDFGHLKYRLLNLNASSSIIEIDLDTILKECISFQNRQTYLFDICLKLLYELKDFNELNNQVLISLSDFLIRNYSDLLNESQLNEFKILQLTARIFQILVQDESIHFDCYKRHHSQPILIIEQLLMNGNIDLTAKTIKMCRDSLNDSKLNSEINNLLVKYAHKALEFRVYKTSESNDDVITTDSNRTNSPINKNKLFNRTNTNGSPLTSSILSNFKSKVSFFQDNSPRLTPSINFIMPTLPPSKEDWIKDEDVDDCMVCNGSRFNILNRRHHCRRCGRVVCSNCSQRSTLIDNVAKRTCDDCYRQLELLKTNEDSNNNKKVIIFTKSHDAEHKENNLQDDLMDQKINFYLIGQSQNETSRMRDEEIRENFRFQQAPSTSLCLSILDLHDSPLECGKDLLNMCDDLSLYLQNASQKVEDHGLVINMIKHLLHNAKVKLLQNSSSNIISLCDSYLSLIDILEQLLVANCSIIPSLNELRNSESVRRTRNRLLEEERHDLAMNLSTKCGLDTQTVWASWGMIELRRSNYKEARAKFEKCLKPSSDKTTSLSPYNSKILNDILTFFENTPPIRILTTQSFLAQLKNVESLIAEPKLYSVGQSHLDDIQFKESMFYLETYGTHSLIISFFQRNGFLENAFKYLIEKKCSTDVFVDTLLATSLRTGEFHRILEVMLAMEKIQTKLHPFYAAIGKYLEKSGFLNTLYDFQILMKDFVRACMSCICFFTRQAETFTDLYNNIHYLNKARRHLEQYLEISANRQNFPLNSQQQLTWKQKSEQNLCKQMTTQEIDSYINAINLQIEVTKFLNNCKNDQNKSKKPPTLFGSNDTKINLCCHILLGGESVQEGFGFVIRIIQCFNLNSTLVYSQISRELAKQFNFKEINNLLKCIDESGYKEDITISYDECISTCIRVFAAATNNADNSQTGSNVPINNTQQAKYNREIESLIQLIKNDENKINAYILNARLKSAYLIAIKIERADIVKHIANVAERMGQNLIKDICTKWLEKNVK